MRPSTTADLPTAKTIEQLRSELGMVQFVRKLIPNLADAIEPLVAFPKT